MTNPTIPHGATKPDFIPTGRFYLDTTKGIIYCGNTVAGGVAKPALAISSIPPPATTTDDYDVLKGFKATDTLPARWVVCTKKFTKTWTAGANTHQVILTLDCRYVLKSLMLYVNGVLQFDTEDYTITITAGTIVIDTITYVTDLLTIDFTNTTVDFTQEKVFANYETYTQGVTA